MPPRYNEPELAKLASDLKACHLEFLNFKLYNSNSVGGPDDTPLKRAYGKITLNQGHAKALAQYRQLKDVGWAVLERLSAAIIAQGMLAPKQHPAILNPSVDNNGWQHELVRGLIQISGQQFFTITLQQAVKHDTYIGIPGICQKYFLIREDPTGATFQGLGPSPVPAIQQKPAMGSPATGPSSDTDGPSPSADDGGLPAPVQLGPGGIQYGPVAFRASHSSSMIMQLGEPPATAAGVAAAAWSEATALVMQNQIKELRDIEALRGVPYIDPSRMSKEDLLKLVAQLEQKHNQASSLLSVLQESTRTLQVRAGDLRVLLEDIDREKTARDRPGPWLAAAENHLSDPRHSHTREYGLGRPDSPLMRHQPAAGALLANSQQSRQQTVQTPAVSRVSPTPAGARSCDGKASGSAGPQKVSRMYPSTEESATQGGPGPNKKLRTSDAQSDQYPAGEGDARHT